MESYESEENLKKLLNEINQAKQDAMYYSSTGTTPPDEHLKKIANLMLDVLRISSEKMSTEQLQVIVKQIENKEFIRNSYANLGIDVDDPLYSERIKSMDENMINGEEYKIFMAELITRSIV